MSNFTKEQKSAFLSLAEEYDVKVYEIISKGGPTEIIVSNKEEAMLLNNFASTICQLVVKNHPDIEGVDEDINADAEMIVYLVTDVLTEAGFDI
ncbi:hypothetical protein MAH1_16570 [Sessilibacter sp. MAH1]